MTDKDNAETDAPKGSKNKQRENPFYTVLTQYVKDLSLENPFAPHSIIDRAEAMPTTNVAFETAVREVESEKFQDLYEVSLILNISTTTEDRIPIILELDYGVLCTVHNIENEKQLHYMLHSELPRILFPYVRQLVSDYTAQAGYNPLYLPPTNFSALYVQRFGETWKDGQELPENDSLRKTA